MEAVMANDDKPAGFLSRWSRRKADVREGRVLEDVPPPSVAPARPAIAGEAGAPAAARDVSVTREATPVPTLADTEQLTPESDFSGFMARGVTPEVKNAAMKKLFADPHFNVMDRMDIYIDDYSQPDPLPLAMLRQMTSAKTLNLFDDEAERADATRPSNVGDKPDVPEVKVVAQSAPTENNSNLEPHTHDHVDLRLQPDPTSRPEGTGSEPV
jgi:hypothetical protein